MVKHGGAEIAQDKNYADEWHSDGMRPVSKGSKCS